MGMHGYKGRYNVVHPVARFFKYVREEPETGCWIWIGAYVSGKDKLPYGKFWFQGRTVPAHLWAFEHLRGIVPDPNKDRDHVVCSNPGCANPWHLEEVTPRENTLRGVGPSAINARKVLCIRGHEFTPENTYVDKLGKRCCRECHNAKMRRRNTAKRAAVDVATGG